MKRYILWALSGLGAILRIIPIWRIPLWYDENFTLLLARLPFWKMIDATAGDVHPPLYYFICWVFYRMLPGLPGWATVRLPALLFGLLSIWVFWAILKRLAISDNSRLVSMGLFAVLPTAIYYSQEGRMYSLLTLLVLLAYLFILKRQYIPMMGICVLLLYTHNYGAIYAFLFHVLYIIKNREDLNPEDHYKIYNLMLLEAALYLPWALIMAGQMAAIKDSYWLVRFNLMSVATDLLHSFFTSGLMAPDIFNMAVFYGVLAWALYRSIKDKTLDRYTLALALGPLVLAVVISLIYQPMILYRALIPCAPFIILLITANTDYLLSKPRITLLACILILPAILVNTASFYFRQNWPTNNYQVMAAVEYIDDNWRAGDLLYHADDGIFINGSANWHNVNNTTRVNPCGPVLGGLTMQTRAALGETIGDISANPGRLWIVTAESPLNPKCESEALAPWLAGDPVMCITDNAITKSCLYLVNK